MLAGRNIWRRGEVVVFDAEDAVDWGLQNANSRCYTRMQENWRAWLCCSVLLETTQSIATTYAPGMETNVWVCRVLLSSHSSQDQTE